MRPARREDLAPYLALALSERAESEAVALPRFERDLREEERCLFVATVGERFAGYGRVAWFEPGGAPAGYYVLGLLVDPGLRRRGIGTALTRARMEWAFARGEAVWCFASARNEASLRLHSQLGFVEVTRDFAIPGVTFEGGEGVLCKAARGTETRWYARAP